MNRRKLVSFIVMIAMIVTSLLPAAGVIAAPLRSPAQVNVAGSFEESIGGSNWSNNDPLTDMADANGDGVWKFAATPAAGDYEYKIVENADWGTSFPADNVAFTADGDEITWRYDENDHFVSDTTRHVVATAVGNFAGAIGGADWSPDNLRTWMKDWDGDGVYTFSATIPEGSYEYKVALNESWDVSFPASNVGLHRPGRRRDVTFYYDSVDNDVWHEVGGGTPPLVVTFPGNWVNAAGLGSDWDPGNLAPRPLTPTATASGSSWPRCRPAAMSSRPRWAAVGTRTTASTACPTATTCPSRPTGGDVHFYYDRGSGDNFVASRPDYTGGGGQLRGEPSAALTGRPQPQDLDEGPRRRRRLHLHGNRA
jgi:hypothetical protein